MLFNFALLSVTTIHLSKSSHLCSFLVILDELVVLLNEDIAFVVK